MNRRAAITGVLGVAGAVAAAAAYNYLKMGSAADYEQAAAAARAALPANPGLRDLVRYATLAANSHNTQPWRFTLDEAMIGISPDALRRTPAADPDDHHLFVSLGCAAENLVVAANATGRAASVQYDPAGMGKIEISLSAATATGSELFGAIPLRQCTRSEFDGKPVAVDDLRRLEQAGREEGVGIRFLTAKQEIEGVLEQIIAANSTQVADPAFVAELQSWLRFNPATAMATGDGLFSACSGNPQLPDWLGGTLFKAFFTEAAETAKIAGQVRSSAGIAVFHSGADDRLHWMRVGRAYQRFALQATALGIRHAHLNQPVEVAVARTGFATALGLQGRRPDLVIRFGYAPLMPMSLRRPVSDVLA